jgi:peptidoglycan/LPS O-acetylase OafA/YrhL
MRTEVGRNGHQPKGASRTDDQNVSPVTGGHRIRQLDAVRGIAILVVILHNEASKYLPAGWAPIFANGWMGVDLFFVLSGFLITGILLDTKGPHVISDFYIRRCLRIWPLYYSLLLFMFVLVPLVRPAEASEIFGERSQPWWSYLLFLQNFFVPIPENAAGPLGVTWSLGIEELFYLMWPWVVRSSSHRTLLWTVIVVVAVSPGLRIALDWYGVNLYANPFCRLDGLMAGALLAAVVRMDGVRATAFVAPARMTLVVTALLAFVTEAADARWIAFSFVAIASMAFVYLSLFDRHPWLRRILCSRFLIYTGTISYGLYLLHKIPFAALESWGGWNGSLAAFCVGLMLCYVLAFLSWHLLERPFLSMRRFFAPTRHSAFR